ncbi:nicotinate-nucleotide--dimethylbenzimidazole phosphoribosyltransferase [Aquipuribacter hungaricus]|uniref:Nicotinate-nucleotide--dimethylbenzimidazole phosphoribosyltransferase n=1 Tax=Aquipuribacter hungaricus TaxID=545624 RepID=A0ABV7WE48_9MICO
MSTLADLQALASDVRPTGRAAEQHARHGVEELLLPTGSLGELQRLAVWWAGVRRDAGAPPPRAVRLLVVVGDHGIAVRGVSALPLGHTAVTLRGLHEGRSAAHAAASAHGVDVQVAEVDVAGPQGPRSQPFDVGPAMDPQLLDDAVAQGAALGDSLADEGLDLLLLGEVGVGGSTTAAAVVGAAQRRRVLEVVGRGSGVDDAAWMRKAAAVREGLRRARAGGKDVPALLEAVGSADVAALTALLLRTAARGLPVVLDGPVSAAAAVLAHRVSPTARQWWLFPERGDEPALHRAQDALGMLPVHALGVRTGLGVAGLTALGTLRTAVAVAVSGAARADLWPVDPLADPAEEDPAHGSATGPEDGAGPEDPSGTVEQPAEPGAGSGTPEEPVSP